MASLSLDRQTAPDDTLSAVAEVLGSSLGLTPEVTASLSAETLLFGNLPELDSMAVATVLTALEDRFDILIDDDEVSGELFETVGSLAGFIAGKLKG
jgi:acyl carrier protein